MSNPRGGSPINPHFFNTPENEQVVSRKVWTEDEILKIWEQSAGELRGFQAHLQPKSPITASQLGLALQLANAEFERLRDSRANHSSGRRCENCSAPLPSGHTAIYCSNECAHDDA